MQKNVKINTKMLILIFLHVFKLKLIFYFLQCTMPKALVMSKQEHGDNPQIF